MDDPARAAKWIGGFVGERPSDIFRRHVVGAPYLSPGYDAAGTDLVDLLGPGQVVFGSDWPHGEGRTSPLDYAGDFAPMSEAARRAVLHDNAATALGLTGIASSSS